MSNKDFEIALRIALKEGYLSDTKEVSQANSKYIGIYYVLKNNTGKTLAQISQGVMAANNPDFVPPPTEESIRRQAINWAESMGYPIPTKWNGCLTAFLVVIGLCAYVIPGLLILLLVWYNGNQYERDMKALVAKWVDAGKPEAGEKAKSVEKLESIETKPSSSNSGTESRLEELLSMKEKGLISPEEYETLRKKALGL